MRQQQAIVLLVWLLAALFASGAAAGNRIDIRQLTGGCDLCHGPGGVSSGPAIPSIAGLPEAYILSTLEGFKSGEIPSTTMGRIVKAYRSDELRALAAHYGRRPFIDAGQPYDPQLAARGAQLHKRYCEKCHAEGGRSVEDEASRLAGQWRLYLTWALQDFRSGRRIARRKMQQQLDRLYIRKGKAGLRALLHYYASQQP